MNEMRNENEMRNHLNSDSKLGKNPWSIEMKSLYYFSITQVLGIISTFLDMVF